MASHLFLVHNLSEGWIFKIDPPMWSVATEWQIYLLFPVRSAWSTEWIAAAIAAGFAVGYAVAALAIPLENWIARKASVPGSRASSPWEWPKPWPPTVTVGAMEAPRLGGTRRRRPRLGRPGSRWTGSAGTDDRNFMIADPIVGVVMAGLLCAWSRRAAPGTGASRLPLLRLLEGAGPSHSGDLLQSLPDPLPAPGREQRDLTQLAVGTGGPALGLFLGASPVILLAASLFHRVFECPFLSAQRRRPGSRKAARRRHPIFVESPGAKRESFGGEWLPEG